VLGSVIFHIVITPICKPSGKIVHISTYICALEADMVWFIIIKQKQCHFFERFFPSKFCRSTKIRPVKQGSGYFGANVAP
jgi:hypothetical protein